MTNLTNQLAALLGFDVELTARSATEFTLSAEGDRVAALRRALAGRNVTGHLYDAEDDFTCVFFQS